MMTNRKWLAGLLLNQGYDDKYVATVISDCLMEITGKDDCSIAVICGEDRELLTKWLGEEV